MDRAPLAIQRGAPASVDHATPVANAGVSREEVRLFLRGTTERWHSMSHFPVSAVQSNLRPAAQCPAPRVPSGRLREFSDACSWPSNAGDRALSPQVANDDAYIARRCIPLRLGASRSADLVLDRSADELRNVPAAVLSLALPALVHQLGPHELFPLDPVISDKVSELRDGYRSLEIQARSRSSHFG